MGDESRPDEELAASRDAASRLVDQLTVERRALESATRRLRPDQIGAGLAALARATDAARAVVTRLDARLSSINVRPSSAEGPCK